MLLSKEKKWKRRTNEYVTYHNTMAALTAIITDSCPDIFYKVLHHPDLGHANRTPREFAVHFWNTYAMDEDPVMRTNLNPMSVQWQPPTILEAWADQNIYVDPAKILADLDPLIEAEERQYLV